MPRYRHEERARALELAATTNMMALWPWDSGGEKDLYGQEHRSLDDWQRLSEYSYLMSLKRRLDAHEKQARRKARLAFVGWMLLMLLSGAVVIATVLLLTPQT